MDASIYLCSGMSHPNAAVLIAVFALMLSVQEGGKCQVCLVRWTGAGGRREQHWFGFKRSCHCFEWFISLTTNVLSS